jgi:23S rRNA pseudouridine1911/1915/1917 synthase
MQTGNKATVPEEFDGVRVDKFLSEINEELSRSYIQKLLKEGHVLVNGLSVKPSFHLSAEDSILFDVPENIVPDIIPEIFP